MKINLFQSVNKIHPILWQFILFGVSIIAFCLVLINPLPGFIRPLSLSLRVDFWPVIPITAVALYLLFRLPGRAGEIIVATAVMVLFAMPLAGMWAYGHTQTSMLGGLIPLNDAQDYYIDASRLANGTLFSSVSTRRPLFSGFLSVLLAITNFNLLTSLAILSAITAVSCLFMSKEIQRTYGTETSTFLLMMVFLYYRLHSGVSMTENFGIALGTLGFTILWRGTADKKTGAIWFGLYITTLALNARAGAFFILPLVILWIGWLFRENRFVSWKSMGIASTAILLGFASSIFLGRLIGKPSGIPFANFSYTMYSLASGGNSWAYIGDTHPEVFLLPDPEHTQRVFQLAFELMREKPMLTVQGALSFWKAIFSDSLYNVFAFVYKENWTISPIVKWTLYLLSILGIFTWYKDKKDPLHSFIMVCAVGIFISIPFAPPIDSFRMRPYAASIAMISILPALGLWKLINATKLSILAHGYVDRSLPVLTNYFAAALILATLIGPVIVKLTASQKIFPNPVCNSTLSPVLIRLNQGGAVSLIKNTNDLTDWPPYYHLNIFRKQAHSIEDGNLIKWAQTIQPSNTIMVTLNFVTMSNILIVLPTEFTAKSGEYLQLCGHYETDPALRYNIFYADQSFPVSP